VIRIASILEAYNARVDAGQILREARLRAGLTQRRLAQLAGVSQPTVARVESGEIRPTFDRLLQLVRACGLDLDVRVVPLDEDAWTLVERGAASTPDERLDRAIAGAALRAEGKSRDSDG
jgi:transcriptional regulator with XRE-family HTH domain